jgi:selT/selW/selH-like putative selenoprotein
LAEKLLDQNKGALAEVALVPSQGGAFEVSVNGAEVYSKLKTGVFPNEPALLSEIASKITA